MNEAEIRDKIRKHWGGKRKHIVSVENTSAAGTPDLNCCFDGIDFWLELKVLRSEYIYAKTHQIPFHLLRNRCGGLSLFFAMNKDQIKVLWLGDPTYCEFHEDMGKFKKISTEDVNQIKTVIQWNKPFKWDSMYDQFMEAIKCL